MLKLYKEKQGATSVPLETKEEESDNYEDDEEADNIQKDQLAFENDDEDIASVKVE